MNKQGSAQDIVLVIVVVFATAVAAIMSAQVYTEFNDSGFFGESETGQEIADTTERVTLPLFDVIVLGVMLMGVLGAILLSFALKSSTAFYFIATIFVMFAMIPAVAIENSWEEIKVQDGLQDGRGYLPMTDNILSNLPLYFAVFSFLLLGVMFALNRAQGGGSI